MPVQQSKDYLIENIVFRLSIHGAFQHNSVYCKKLSKKENKTFKDYLRKQLSKRLSLILAKPNYSDQNHYRSIINFSEKVSSKFSSFLNKGEFNIGTAQKLLNLYWKGNWVFKKGISSPIHCPFDGIIIGKLPKHVRYIRWTKMNDIEEYKLLVAAAKEKSKGKNLGQWELITYNQSNFMA